MVKINKKLIVIALIFGGSTLILSKPAVVYSQPGYCANQTVIHQWSCKIEDINLCNTQWWYECPEKKCSRRGSGTCPQKVSYKCQVIGPYYADCHSTPRCETNIVVNDCQEGATWRSSCKLFNSRPHGCWVYTCGNGTCESQYGENSSNCSQDCGVAPTPTPTPTPTPSCTVNLIPDTATVQISSSTTLIASVTIGDGTVSQVNFVSGNTGIVTLSPASDSTVIYSTQATGVAVGSTTARADVIMDGASRCNDTSNVTVTLPGPWWQVIDADVITNEDLRSRVPAGQTFGLDGAGGYPGVPAYGGTAFFGSGSISSKNWSANTTSSTRRIYDFSYFEKQIRSDVVIEEITSISVPGTFFASGGTPFEGYYWYQYDGSQTGFDLTISSDANLGNRKVILLVKGADLYLNGKVNLDDGAGFFGAFVGKNPSGRKGNILVGPTVAGADGPELEGIFLADSEVKTGAGTDQLYFRGAVAAYEGISLQRDLADDSSTPAELFEYAPDQILLFPPRLSVQRIRWAEVAP